MYNNICEDRKGEGAPESESHLALDTLPGPHLALSLTVLALPLRPPLGSNSHSASSDANMAATLALQDSRCHSMQNASLAPLRVSPCRANFFDEW